MIVAERVDDVVEPRDDLEGMTTPEPEFSDPPDHVGDDVGPGFILIPVEHQAEVLDVGGEPIEGVEVTRSVELRCGGGGE